MFVFRKTFPFTATVTVPAGVVPAFDFQGKFETIGQAELDRMEKEDGGLLDAKVAARVFKGWNDDAFSDEAGQVLPATPDNIAAVIDQPFLRGAIVRAYFAAMNGLLAAKN